MRDTYDFNVDWFEDAFFGLGIWGKKRMLTKKEMAIFRVTQLAALANVFPAFVPVRNGDFRRWQGARNEGGDFFVFSDVMWMPPNVEYVYF